MTAQTRPARPEEDDARLRPVPWRRMAGVTWRQHRYALAGVTVLLGALAVWLWIIGTPLHHAYAAALACHPASSPACAGLDSTFQGMDNLLTGPTTPGGVFLQVVPVLIGAFAGAPVLAREMETGTFRYAWTQGFGRWRWALAKLTLLAAVLAAAGAAFSVLLSWFYRPYFAPGNQALGPYANSPFAWFNLREVAFPAWILVAFAIGALAGMLIRRVVPAIAATLVVYTGPPPRDRRAAARALPDPAGHHQQLQPAQHRVDRQPVDGQGRQVRLRWPSPHQPRQQVLLFRSSRAGQGGHFAGSSRAVPGSARLHAVDHLPASQPVLAIPVDPGRLAARAVSAAHRGNGLAGPPPRHLTPPAMRPLRVLPSSGEGFLRQMKARWSARPALNRRAASIRQK